MDHLSQLRAALSGEYLIERELGGGGMSRVYVAQESRLHRRVVIKVVSPELAQGLSIERFEREIQLAASLSQANIVPVLSAGDVDGLPYFTMPFVDGESLRHRLGQGPLPIAEVVNILRDVSRALSYAHRHDIVHRDIKPDNVLLSSGAAVVTDFGIAKALSAARTQDGGAQLTQTGVSIGTAAYMSPEQAAGDPSVDQRSDIYSLGAMAYELLTGKPPFVRESLQRVLAAQLTETPVPVTQLRRDTPAPLAALVMRCLEKDPAKRPRDADEVLRALDGVHVTAPIKSARNKSFVGIGAIAALLLLALAARFAWIHRTPHNGAASAVRSLAVLPIENVGGDSTKEYLADGMTSELAGNLRQTQGLEVIGDLSTSRFKRSTLGPSDIASQLHVGMLLSGKLQSQGSNVRLQMQLYDAGGKLLWSQKYDREMKDDFALQDEVASAIAREMQLVLTPASSAGRTENAAAHDLYMHGVFEKNKLDSASLRRALAYFQQALALDPHYARAHEGMAFAYDMLADVYAPSHEYHTLALSEAQRAVTDDSALADARVIYGFERAAALWDFDGGLKEMNRGLALNATSPDAMLMAAAFSMLSGNEERALRLSDSMARVDPLSPLPLHFRAEVLLWQGKYAEALAAKIAAKKVDPTVVLIECTEGHALLGLGRLDEALAAFLDFKKTFNLPSFGLVGAYARLGRRDDALREIQWMEDQRKTRWVDPDFIAMAYAALGDKDNAMKWLNQAYEMKTYFLRLSLNWDMPWLKPLNGDPRFEELKRKVRS